MDRLRYWWTMVFLIPWTLLFGTGVVLARLLTFTDRISARLGRLWARGLLWVTGTRLTVHGREHFDPKKQYIFVANHTSAFDIPSMYCAIPNQVGMLAKIGLAYIPLFGWAMWAAGHFFINRHDHSRAMSAMEQVNASLKRYPHRSLVVYPEGTRSLDGQLHPFKKGAFLMSLQSEIPIVPLVINGGFEAKSKYARSIPRPALDLRFFPPISPADYRFETRDQFIADTFRIFQTHYRAPGKGEEAVL